MTQDELLEAEDGRYFAIDKVGTGIGSIATTEKLGRLVISFGLPSAPGLFLNMAHSLWIDLNSCEVERLFDQHQNGVWPDDQGRLFDALEKISGHVIFSFTAMEAFINEAIPGNYIYQTVDKGNNQIELDYKDIERKLSTTEKLDKVLPDALKVNSPKGTKVWQNYVELKRLRDRLIHLKSDDRKRTGPEIATIWGDLLRNIHTPFCNQAHELMGSYGNTVKRRWYNKYPYNA